MQKLAQREEQIMQAFWELGKAFIRDIIPLLPDPKPHYNSVATMVKILEEKKISQARSCRQYELLFSFAKTGRLSKTGNE